MIYSVCGDFDLCTYTYVLHIHAKCINTYNYCVVGYIAVTLYHWKRLFDELTQVTVSVRWAVTL